VKAAQAAGSRPLLFGVDPKVSSNAADWESKVPFATTAHALFQVAAGCLGEKTLVDPRDRSSASFGQGN